MKNDITLKLSREELGSLITTVFKQEQHFMSVLEQIYIKMDELPSLPESERQLQKECLEFYEENHMVLLDIMSILKNQYQKALNNLKLNEELEFFQLSNPGEITVFASKINELRDRQLQIKEKLEKFEGTNPITKFLKNIKKYIEAIKTRSVSTKN